MELDNTTERTYLCEVCGSQIICTEQTAFDEGWDYPPFIGQWGIVSPRTCGNCPIDKTAWWAVVNGKVNTLEDLPAEHQATIKRILEEQGPGQ